MKKQMLLACGLLIALFTTRLSAQQNGVYVVHLDEEVIPEYKDTLVININENNKILFIGDGFKEMRKYDKADSIKTLFIADWEKALAAGTVKQETQRVFYFVDRSGKRRLKAESAEYTEKSVDVNYEIKRLRLGLSKYEYKLYDLKTGYRLEFYLDDPAQLKNLLGGMSINDAINFAKSTLKKDLNRSYKVELATDNNTYKKVGRTQGFYASIEFTPSFGVGMIGNTIAPVAGLDYWMRFTDKYSVSQYKVGVGLTTFPFVHAAGGEVTGVSFVRSYDLKLLANLAANKTKPHWIGLSGGFTKSNELKSFNKAFKFGILYEGNGPFNYSFDYIVDTNKNPIYGLTMKLPF